VIGIIAVLIGILLPTIAGARRAAAATKCASNLRSLGQALHLYANEQRGYVPTYRSTYAGNARVPWYDQLARYVYNRPPVGTPPTILNDDGFASTIFAGCPAFTYQRVTGINVIETSTGYGINYLPVSPLAPPERPPRDCFNIFVQTNLTAGRYFKLVEFKNPANRAMMADMNGWGGLRALDPDPTYYTLPNGNRQQGDIDYFRHGRYMDLSRTGANVLFCDGHVDLCTPWQAWWSVRDPSRRATGNDKGP